MEESSYVEEEKGGILTNFSLAEPQRVPKTEDKHRFFFFFLGFQRSKPTHVSLRFLRLCSSLIPPPLFICDLAGALKEAHRPQNLANASHSCTEQPTDDTLGDDEYVRSTHVPRDCNFEEPVVGDNEQPRPQRRSEPSVGSRRPRNASRGAAIDSQMQTLSKYLEWKMAKKTLAITVSQLLALTLLAPESPLPLSALAITVSHL
ncbi:hypothetical protein HHK36_016997 [Tetracentron sinense]|uniref:Uncharacterized protein n=1 Tax=Tetracentron sinense TaxID=13715 RepID=A0A834Z2B6_TETSI|nr:hypothetical protein HHK36_016997 [Tetracentron sinense]